MNCANCEHFRSLGISSSSEGHCFVNPPIPIKWRETKKEQSFEPSVTLVEVVQFGPVRTFGDLKCGLWEAADSSKV